MSQENLREQLIEMYCETSKYTRKFHKKTYESDMDNLKTKYNVLMVKIRDAYEESDTSMKAVAAFIPDYVSELLDSIPSKRKRELACFDNNMNMVSFFVPLMGEITSSKSKEFVEAIVDLYNHNMPQNKIGYSTRESIQSGFRKGILCYITTAVCKSLHKPDDCRELTLLRDYRDTYLLKTKDGKAAVEQYYNIAPTIVKRIDKQENSAVIYNQIWQEYLSPCVDFIETGKKEECKVLYRDMVLGLEKIYLYSQTGETKGQVLIK